MQPEGAETAHSTSIEWREPSGLYAGSLTDSGLDYLRGMAAGTVLRPPMAQVLGIEVASADEGKVRFTMPVLPFLTNHLGFLAGGILATVLDTALGCAALSVVPPDQDIVTLDLKVEFLRPVRRDSGPVVVDAEVVHQGRNRALASCQAFDSAGRLCAVGTSNCMIRPKTQAG